MSGINRYILSQHPNAKNIADYFTPEAIANCNPEEEQETSTEESAEHKLGQEVEGK